MSLKFEIPADWGKSNRSVLIEITEVPDGAEFQILLRDSNGIPTPASEVPEEVLQDHGALLLFVDRMLANTKAVPMEENEESEKEN